MYVEIFDLKGKLINKLDFSSGMNEQIEFGQDLDAGFYIVNLITDNGVLSRKIFKLD